MVFKNVCIYNMFRKIVHKILSFHLFEIKLTITIIHRITLSLLENHTLDHRDNAEVHSQLLLPISMINVYSTFLLL